MRLFHHNSARRREVRRSLPRQDRWWTDWLQRREFVRAALFATLLATVASLIAVAAQNRTPYAEGQVVPASVVARVDFRATDDAATAKAKSDARDREPAVYSPNPKYFQFVHDQFDALAHIATDPATTADIPRDGLVQLRSLFAPNGQPTPAWTVMTDQFIDDLSRLAILSPAEARIELDEHQRADKIIIQPPAPGAGDVKVYRNEIFSVGGDNTQVYDRIDKKVREKFGKLLARPIVTMLMLNPHPTYQYNAELTRQRRLDRFASEPAVTKAFHADDVIVSAGHKLSAADLDLLERERQAYAASMAQTNPLRPFLSAAGMAGLVGIISLSFWAYILAYNPRIARNPMRGMAFTALLILAQAAAVWATVSYPRLIYLTATLPTLLTGIILAIAYDRRFAMAVGSLQTLLVMLTLNLPPEFAFVMLVGVAISVGLLDEVRTRMKLVATATAAGLGMALAVIAAGLALRPMLPANPPYQLFADARTVLLTAVAAGLLVNGVLPLVERAFRVTTAMTLSELNDATRPLLHRLAQEAPGTYQHSLRVSDMAETAAQAIGADALLCKVGAMYHDIGKINKPQYFVENQAGGPNRHDKLSPAMSLLIIVGHVKDGVEMAREYRLPPTLRQFIESHHGTTLVEYFYHAARQQREGQDAPSEFEYRYPGPKPQTRESAILMLCDGIEGASRALPDPAPAKLEQFVYAMAQKRLADGQFDECGITLQELHKIEQAILKTLVAMYHGRIAYPKTALTGTEAAS